MTQHTKLAGQSSRDTEFDAFKAYSVRYRSLFKTDFLLIATLALFLVVFASGCATRSDYVLPEEARKLTANEISIAFSDVRAEFESIDDAPLTATMHFVADETFRANWEKGWFFDGSVEGNWHTEDDQLCFKTTTKVDGSYNWCVAVYELDGVYTSVHPDGSYGGIYTLAPMGEELSL